MESRVKQGIGSLSLFVAIVTGAILLAIWAIPLYEFFVRLLDLNDIVGLTVNEVMLNYRELLAYLNFPWVKELHLPNFPVSESGAFHFYEVKKWFLICYILFIVGCIGSYFYLRYLKKNKAFGQLVKPFRWLGGLMIVLLLVLLFGDFDAIFTAFHHLLFHNSAWLFDPQTDPIILVLPEEFFFACFVFVFVLIELGCWCLQKYGQQHR